jgi:hypothetical protein
MSAASLVLYPACCDLQPVNGECGGPVTAYEHTGGTAILRRY